MLGAQSVVLYARTLVFYEGSGARPAVCVYVCMCVCVLGCIPGLGAQCVVFLARALVFYEETDLYPSATRPTLAQRVQP